jgi:YhcH/YjgK/YiaL family protein
MVLDWIENADRYSHLHPGLGKAFQFLRHKGLAALPPGRHDIEGSLIYAIVARESARQRDKALLEAHRRYVDIQMVLGGIDGMGWKPRAACAAPAESYDAERDIEFFLDRPDSWVSVQPGQFAVFFPEDAHAPLVGENEIHKIVVKVAVSIGHGAGHPR